jgi:5-methylcytosine-specific restriction endonuclease McrBC GTP-binding regulatory subunit McrB
LKTALDHLVKNGKIEPVGEKRYFAPFLSAMETGEQLHLHAHSDVVNGAPPSIRWPKNLFIGGTVNMDETTHPFSDKVLDRAFTFEFWDVNLQRYLAQRAANNQRKRHGEIEKLLLEMHTQLQIIRRQFAYRTNR